MSNDVDLSIRGKLHAIRQVASYRPKFTALIVVASMLAAALDAIGLSFLLPIIELAQAEGDPAAEAEGITAMFVTAYQFLGIPFTLETVILGVALVITARYTSSFFVGWLVAILKYNYKRELQERAFNSSLDARVAYFDVEGSDEILNAIITQASYAGQMIQRLVRVFEISLLCIAYVAIAIYISPLMTALAAIIFAVLTLTVRHWVEPAYTVGDRVAEANERIQRAAQAGTQGIRDVKLFGMSDRLTRTFSEAIAQYERASIRLARNEIAVDKFYNLASAMTVFVLIYVALTFSGLSLGALGVFLLAMFMLAPRISNLNSEFYKLEGTLPHFVRTVDFIEELESQREHDEGSNPVPQYFERIDCEDVRFSYPTGEEVLKGISFGIRRGDFVAFVGQSGAGKSTIVSLIARMYDVDSGRIAVDGYPIDTFDLEEWRSKVAVVRQNPFVFNETLRYNLTIGNEDVSEARLDRICEITKVSEFLYDLSDGYETKLGDDGVKLSGGQRQRVALARALLKDAEILILDEATSDLDSHLEHQVHQAIESMEGEYTIIAIAHRLSTVRNANRIYTVEDGRITEQGRHEELIHNGGKYAQLYSTQVQG